MTHLQCDVKNCANYKDELCCKPDIKIDGPCACGCEQTCCSSFFDAGSSGAENSVGYNNLPNLALEIDCSANNCVYNTNNKCFADEVSVNPEADYPDTAAKTECSTFRFR